LALVLGRKPVPAARSVRRREQHGAGAGVAGVPVGIGAPGSAATGGREPALDRLKAIAIGLVFLWHLHPIYVEHAPPIEWCVRFFDFEISLTAVPTFLVVSLWLFYPRAAEGVGRLLGRL